MNLNQSDKAKITKWLQDKCGQMRCTCCGFGKWELVNMATLPIGIDLRSTRFFYAQGLPQISVACLNCGHLLLFSPGIMGIQPDKPEEPSVADEPKSAGETG